MSLNNILPQEKILYNRRWNKAMDTIFIEVLVEQNRLGNWGGRTELNYHDVAIALGDVNEKFALNMSWEDAVARRHFLEDRYDPYDDVINTPIVWWD
ncbi:hypothetical protein ACS0TY_007692 [Phlomoides rotata]